MAIRLEVVPLAAANISKCVPLWGDGATYTRQELAHAVQRVARLLDADRARGAIFSDHAGRVYGFGIATFVHKDFAAEYLAAPYAQIRQRILSHPSLDDIVLDDRGVGRRNARGGLHLVVLNQGYDFTGPSEEWPLLAGTSMRAFIDFHRGFNITGIINEIFGPAVALLERIRPAPVHRFSIATRSGDTLESGWWTLTRAEVERDASFMLPMFLYAPPLIRCTAPERHVLKAALSGATDGDIAIELGIRISAVKSRWLRIQERAASVPELEQWFRARKNGNRGPQRRHLITRYVRDHPEELTPYYLT